MFTNTLVQPCIFIYTNMHSYTFLLFPFCLYATIAMHSLCTLCTRFAFGKYRILKCHDSTQDPFNPPVLSAFRRPCFRLRLSTCFTSNINTNLAHWYETRCRCGWLTVTFITVWGLSWWEWLIQCSLNSSNSNLTLFSLCCMITMLLTCNPINKLASLLIVITYSWIHVLSHIWRWQWFTQRLFLMLLILLSIIHLFKSMWFSLKMSPNVDTDR